MQQLSNTRSTRTLAEQLFRAPLHRGHLSDGKTVITLGSTSHSAAPAAPDGDWNVEFRVVFFRHRWDAPAIGLQCGRSVPCGSAVHVVAFPAERVRSCMRAVA